MLQNSIYANGGLGIDLAGTTTNDPGDADAGPNDLQNKPVLSSAKTSATSTTVRGTLNSTSGKTIVVRFFSNPSGTDEGKTFIGQKCVTTDASGNATFTFSPAQKVGLGRTVTATATSQKATPPSSRLRDPWWRARRATDELPTLGARHRPQDEELPGWIAMSGPPPRTSRAIRPRMGLPYA